MLVYSAGLRITVTMENVYQQNALEVTPIIHTMRREGEEEGQASHRWKKERKAKKNK